MKLPSEQSAMKMVAERLAELVHVEPGELRAGPPRETGEADRIVEAGAFTFAVTWKESGAAGPVARAIERNPKVQPRQRPLRHRVAGGPLHERGRSAAV